MFGASGAMYILAEADLQTFYVDEVLSFYITFDSAISPTASELSRLTVSQGGDNPACDADCFDVLQFYCDTCDAGTASSPGAAMNFSVVLSSDVLLSSNTGTVTTTFDLVFEFSYTDSRRQLKPSMAKKSFPVSFKLRDFDCHNPSALFGKLVQLECPGTELTKGAICSRDQGWIDVNSCPAASVKNVSALILLGVLFAALSTL